MFPLKISQYISKWLDYHNISPGKVEIKSTTLQKNTQIDSPNQKRDVSLVSAAIRQKANDLLINLLLQNTSKWFSWDTWILLP